MRECNIAFTLKKVIRHFFNHCQSSMGIANHVECS